MSSQRKPFPKITIVRLSGYYRALEDAAVGGMESINSQELGHRLRVKASQVRKDLTYFGEFGKRGMGYNVNFLMRQLKDILGINREWNLVVVGAGKVGQALLGYEGFRQRGFHIKAIFDSDPTKAGQTIGHLTVLPLEQLEEVIAREEVELGVIAVPAKAAQEVADLLVKSGVKGIMNFASTPLSLPARVKSAGVDLTTTLEFLCHQITNDSFGDELETG